MGVANTIVAFCLFTLSCSEGNRAFKDQLRYLNDADPLKRAQAARVIGASGSGAKVCLPNLRNSLKNDQDPYVRVRVAEAIWSLDSDETVIPVLVDALDSRGTLASRAAIVVLGSIGPKASRATPRLMLVMKDETDYGKVMIASALVQINEKHKRFSIPIIKQGLRSDRAFVRQAAAEECGKHLELALDLVADLRNLEADEDENVQNAATLVLMRIKKATIR